MGSIILTKFPSKISLLLKYIYLFPLFILFDMPIFVAKQILFHLSFIGEFTLSTKIMIRLTHFLFLILIAFLTTVSIEFFWVIIPIILALHLWYIFSHHEIISAGSSNNTYDYSDFAVRTKLDSYTPLFVLLERIARDREGSELFSYILEKYHVDVYEAITSRKLLAKVSLDRILLMELAFRQAKKTGMPNINMPLIFLAILEAEDEVFNVLAKYGLDIPTLKSAILESIYSISDTSDTSVDSLTKS